MRKFHISLIICMLLFSGCDILDGNTAQNENAPNESAVQYTEDETANVKDEVIQAVNAIYNRLGITDSRAIDTETVIAQLGQQGYVAVDYDNQIDMVNSAKLRTFLKRYETGEAGNEKITVLRISKTGELSEYVFLNSNKDSNKSSNNEAGEGGITVYKRQYMYDGTDFNLLMSSIYKPDVFRYTPEGYLMMEGHWDSAQMYVLALAEEEEHVALRVDPMDTKLRELTAKYLLPVSYGGNNIFITSWSEEDYGGIDFYDVFESLYKNYYNRPLPYGLSDDMSSENIYSVPAKELEDLVREYFNVSTEELHTRLKYNIDTDCYLFSPRGYDETDYCEVPYPEVYDYHEEDGIITLEVNAVFAVDNTSKLFSHELKVREDADGKITYVSNEADIAYDSILWWHSTRKEIDTEALSEAAVVTAAGNIAGNSNAGIITESNSVFYDVDKDYFTEAEKAEIEKTLLGMKADAMDKSNKYKDLVDFYEKYEKGMPVMATVYEVRDGGIISAMTFLYRDNALQSYYVEAQTPETEGTQKVGSANAETEGMQITARVLSDIDRVILTEKGYFFYSYKNTMEHESLGYCYRTVPLDEMCARLTEKCLKGFDDFQKYKLLSIDWDLGTVSNVLDHGLFEDFYHIMNKKAYNGDLSAINGELFEKIMMTYLPITPEQLRSAYKYDEKSKTYSDEEPISKPYSPFLEVVRCEDNADGTITLYTDGVWPDFMTDKAFSNVIVIKPMGDNFQILSNRYTEYETP